MLQHVLGKISNYIYQNWFPWCSKQDFNFLWINWKLCSSISRLHILSFLFFFRNFNHIYCYTIMDYANNVFVVLDWILQSLKWFIPWLQFTASMLLYLIIQVLTCGFKQVKEFRYLSCKIRPAGSETFDNDKICEWLPSLKALLN